MKVGPDAWITAIRMGCRLYGIIKGAQSHFNGAVFIHRAINWNGDPLHIYKKWIWWFILYSHNSSFFLQDEWLQDIPKIFFSIFHFHIICFLNLKFNDWRKRKLISKLYMDQFVTVRVYQDWNQQSEDWKMS
jgi:hypothetical protein